MQYDPGYPEVDQTNYGFNKGKKKQRGRDNRKKSNDKDGGNRRNSGAKWNEQCPLHPNNEHTWGQCRSNPASQNFKPLDGSFKSSRRGDNRNNDRDSKKPKNAKGESKRNSDAHHYDVDDHHGGSKNHKRSSSRC